MPPTDPTKVLLTHDRWANAQLYKACNELTPEQLNHPFEMGTGSIHNNIVHNLAAMRGWTDVLNEVEARYRLENESYTIDQIIELEPSIADEFEQAALRRPFDTIIKRDRGEQTYTFSVGGIITHVTTHSVHHRAQCCNMLRQLGIENQPMSSVFEWMLTSAGYESTS